MHKLKIINLVFIYLFILYFSRLLVSLGMPSIINQIHLVIILIIFAFTFTRVELVKNIGLLFLIFSFFVLNILSSLFNDISLVAGLLNFVILCEPFLLLYILLLLKKEINYYYLYNFLVSFFIMNLIFVIIQSLLYHNPDKIQGVLLNMGNGAHVVSASMAIIAIVLFQMTKNNIVKISVYMLVFFVTIVADAKQVVVVFGLATLSLFFYKTRIYIKLILILAAVSLVFMLNIIHSFLPAYGVWIDNGLDIISEGFILKYNIFIELYNNGDIFNSLIGFGPGQTVSRLAMMISDYPILYNFGITDSPLYKHIYDLQESHYLTNVTTGSSMFTLMFSWSGIYGDLGVLGLVNYLGIIMYIYMQYANSTSSKYVLIISFLFGSISLWFGESIYMITLMIAIVLLYKNITFSKGAKK